MLTLQKNANFSDHDRIILYKRIAQEKKRESETRKKIPPEDKAFSIQIADKFDREFGSHPSLDIFRLMAYLEETGPENHITFSILVGVFWDKPLPPRTEEEQAEFDCYIDTMSLALRELQK